MTDTQAETQLKFCKDCKNYGPGSPLYEVCLHPSTAGRNLVTGAVSRKFCVTQRDHLGACGPEGKLWEAKS